ncbi:MAG: hypothetical protein AAGF11_14375 [Myxococcota bacterium]
MTAEELKLFYEPRSNNHTLRRVLTQLRMMVSTERCLHALYMGPAGCGKSTDLTWLIQQIANDSALSEPLMILHYDIGDAVGRHDVGFGDLDCHLLFTAPSALRLEARYQAEVTGHFVECRATLDRPVRQDDGDGGEYNTLRRIIYRRIVPELVDSSAVDRLIMSSGGLVSQVIDGMFRATLRALTDDSSRIELDHVEAELKEIASGYLNMLRDEHYRELDRIEKEGLSTHVEDPALLHSRCVLEYPDSPSEFEIHPLVLPLLLRWRVAAGRSQ